MPDQERQEDRKPDLSWYVVVWVGFLIIYVAVVVVDLSSDDVDRGTATGAATVVFFLASLVLFALRGFAKRQHEQTVVLTSTDPPNAPRMDDLDALAKLADLRERGALTDEEFEAKKAELLRRDGGP